MRRAIGIGLLLLVGLLVPRLAEANILCGWFALCYYESPGFRIFVVDRETGTPLEGVHALAEWVQYGYHGTDGPLMVQDALSGPDGLLVFPAWGPLRGSSAGLAIGSDPFVSLFKPGYKVYETNNIGGPGDERTRVRGFTGDGQTYFLEPFRGSPNEWVQHLRRAAYPNRLGGTSEAQLLEFRLPYLNRSQTVQTELTKLPKERKEVQDLAWSLQRKLRFLQEGSR